MALLLFPSVHAIADFSNQKRRGEAFHESFIPKVTTPVKHETSKVTIPFHTNDVRRPPSGPNPEGNFEVNAATQDTATRGFKVTLQFMSPLCELSISLVKIFLWGTDSIPLWNEIKMYIKRLLISSRENMYKDVRVLSKLIPFG